MYHEMNRKYLWYLFVVGEGNATASRKIHKSNTTRTYFRRGGFHYQDENRNIVSQKKVHSSATSVSNVANFQTGSRIGGASMKGSTGLRHFSLKVCQKVEEKQLTTYNEVADELVNEFMREKELGLTDMVCRLS